MSWLVDFQRFAEHIDPTTLQYFFSALAQSAAAIVGLMAVFSVFRLQTHQNEIGQAYHEAQSWVADRLGRNLLTSPRKEIVRLLDEAMNEQGTLWQTIKGTCTPPLDNIKTQISQLREAIRIGEAFPGELVHQMIVPMCSWGSIFFGSMLLITVTNQLKGYPGYVAMGVALVAILITAWITKDFVQRCLASPMASREKLTQGTM